MSDKPRVAFAGLAWASAFARIEEGQKLYAKGIEYRVTWKHQEPDWLMLLYRFGKKRGHPLMVRKGDPLLLELRPE
jgi:hypothetical protein